MTLLDTLRWIHFKLSVMISPVTIIFSLRNLVKRILVFNGGRGLFFSLVTAFLLGGNHPLTYATLRGSWLITTFAP